MNYFCKINKRKLKEDITFLFLNIFFIVFMIIAPIIIGIGGILGLIGIFYWGLNFFDINIFLMETPLISQKTGKDLTFNMTIIYYFAHLFILILFSYILYSLKKVFDKRYCEE